MGPTAKYLFDSNRVARAFVGRLRSGDSAGGSHAANKDEAALSVFLFNGGMAVQTDSNGTRRDDRENDSQESYDLHCST
jgi:hypothetical protein